MHKVQTSTLSLYTKLEMDEDALGPCGCLLVVKSLALKWMRDLLLTFHHTMRCTSATGWISISSRFWEITLTFSTKHLLHYLLWVICGCVLTIHKRAFDCQWTPTPIEELSISVSMQSWIHLTHNRLWKCCTHLGLLIRSFGLDLWWHAEMCYFHQKF